MAKKIDFSNVGRYGQGNGYEPVNKLAHAEPIWHCEDGTLIPISQLADGHLQRIERWLRGGGATLPNEQAHSNWYATIKAEFDKRNLASLPDHPAVKERDPIGQTFKSGESFNANYWNDAKRESSEGGVTFDFTGGRGMPCSEYVDETSNLTEEKWNEMAKKFRERLMRNESQGYFESDFKAQDDQR